ncbi:MAG: TonB-dependent receptor [Dysgonomonas sp.]
MRKYSLLYAVFTLCCIVKAEAGSDLPLSDKDTIVMSYTADEVVIQAFKQNKDLALLPISATLLSDKTIKDRNITNIKEITSFVPNLFMPDYGSKMISPAYIRGIGSRINAPSIGLYVDGVPYFDRSTFDFSLNDIDRIEVLRGPQGTIYGRNTMGGIINVYTKSPFKYKETNLGLSVANYNNYLIEASHYGNVKNTFGYSFSGNYQHSGGYFNNSFTGKKADPSDAVSSRVRLSWRVQPQLYIHFSSAYEYSDQDGYPYGIYNADDNSVNDVNYNARSFYRRNMSTSGLNIEYFTPSFRFGSQTSFQYFDGKQGLDQDFTPKDQYYVNFFQRQQMYSQEFNIKSTTNSKYKWQFGAFGFHQNYKTNNDIEYLASDSLNHQNISTPSTGFALYHQSTIDNLLTNGLSLIMGVRYDWEEIKMHTILNNEKIGKPQTEALNVEDKAIYSQFTPKVSLQYTFTNDEIVYASATKGYKAGGFNTTMETEEARSFDPEHSWCYEVGTKASCLNKLIYTDISLFYINWHDQQISQTKPNGGKGYILRNAGKSESKGAEITMHINPLENLSVQLGYGYTHAKFKEYEKTATISYTGNYLPMVPSNTFSAGADYSIRLKNSFFDKININGQYSGLGKLYWTEENNAIQPFYGTLNGKLSFIKDKILVELWAKNITNTKYVTYYFTSGSAFAQRGKPCTFGLNFNYKF